MAVPVRVAQARPKEAPLAADVAAILRSLDWILLAAVGALVAYGLWILDAVTRNDVPGSPDYFVVRQGVNVALGLVALTAAALVNPEVYRRLRKPLYVALLAILVLVFVADQIRGTNRWIEVGFFRFQPSELGKVLVAIVVAAFIAERSRRLGEWGTTFGAVGLAAVPTVLVFLEPDFGTALIYGAVLAAALFVAGTRWLHLAALAVTGLFTAALMLWILPSAGIQVLHQYQVERLTGFLNPDRDPSGATYNVTQSITAVGSGGFDGRGGEGEKQKNTNYLPEHQTDFIFASLAEQRGFLGAALLLLLYAIIAWRGVKTIALAPSLFTAALAAALVLALVVQVFINIGMTIGVAPVTGIPLPFMSYGGSSMIASFLMIGLLEAIHARGRLAGRD
jgi:rod shape determining protein RodA